MLDPSSGVLLVSAGQRLRADEAEIIRQAIADGLPVQFASRHQYRHFMLRHPHTTKEG